MRPLSVIAKRARRDFCWQSKKEHFCLLKRSLNQMKRTFLHVKYPHCSMRFIIVHGPQETDSNEAKSDFYESLMVEIEKGKASDDNVVILGDLNARIHKGVSGIEAVEKSSNGKLLKEVVEKYQL